jgi:hypothetical protein
VNNDHVSRRAQKKDCKEINTSNIVMQKREMRQMLYRALHCSIHLRFLRTMVALSSCSPDALASSSHHPRLPWCRKLSVTPLTCIRWHHRIHIHDLLLCHACFLTASSVRTTRIRADKKKDVPGEGNGRPASLDPPDPYTAVRTPDGTSTMPGVLALIWRHLTGVGGNWTTASCHGDGVE